MVRIFLDEISISQDIFIHSRVQLGINHQVVLLLRIMMHKLKSTRNLNAQLQGAFAAKYICAV
ncbi:MAG: hypothetical protein MUO76_14720, partial [Anaerolineaceae bacterium]|nr:hypothetical protein [Anaerolineaceae bacterium]